MKRGGGRVNKTELKRKKNIKKEIKRENVFKSGRKNSGTIGAKGCEGI